MKIEQRYTPPAVKREPEKTIKVRMLKRYSGHPLVGEIDEMPASKAHEWVKAMRCEYVDPADAPPKRPEPWTFEEKDGVLFVRVVQGHKFYSPQSRRGTTEMGVSVLGRHIPAGVVIDVPATIATNITWHGGYGAPRRSVRWHDEEPPEPAEIQIPKSRAAQEFLAKKLMAVLSGAGGAKASRVSR